MPATSPLQVFVAFHTGLALKLVVEEPSNLGREASSDETSSLACHRATGCTCPR